ncbi:MAG: hypothetical protein APG08_00624 [Candidatus Methanofastidiosum methylothiophilum]|jgi:hypothetical protein|uniref:Uncharacterized protein n=1 Tax=Candidatus Methanofastidiosum methylothiophilum TaxID=1705564 RepID=A0A150JN30_9EURY|nr:MAG: hypothetical protein AN188_00746 [Candidatus Methanofastidiosum methylthiophilus]MBP6932566.1 hypothetical protein [Methanofastidiosum sp.]OQC52175.1 MAG: hypothetical protein BWX56_00462 [Euryarchaeota archaeon ADurb.Bin023]KYC56859.1 MAG: hypothetical protein APG08_00624 [Candidatus Methanofastidiosum methylthiophilus]KYC58639.1 MAG: hypothetical protein APG09_00114 [Candidatus Methanofastidiosum methylthiophilus]
MRATDPQILEAIKSVLKKDTTIHSQKELFEKVKKKLSNNEEVQISAERIRRIAKKNGIRIQVHSRKGKEIKTCPFCNNEFQDILSEDLFGKSTVIGKLCKNCKFEIGVGRSPARYIFRK